MARITIDGLWRCLCPSIDPITLTKALEAPSLSQFCNRPHRFLPRIPCRRRNLLHTTSRQRDSDSYVATPFAGAWPSSQPAADITVWDLLNSRPPYRELHRATPSVIQAAVNELRDNNGQTDRITAFVLHLLTVHREPPTHWHYLMLFTAHLSVNGSADSVRELRKAMREGGIEGRSGTYHTILRALAIHPDYLQRNSALREMAERWIELLPEGHTSIAIGLLRDGQYELAVDKLEEMAREGIPVPPWVFDIFVYTLGRMGFLDESLEILHHRLLKGEEAISLNVWHFLLDECSREQNYEGTQYVWNRMVRQNQVLSPSDGILLNVLSTASRHKDDRMATQVIELMSSRGMKLGVHHYEALIDCYAEKGDVQNALQVLCIMNSAGVQCDQASTRSIYFYLKKLPGPVDREVRALCNLAGKHDVPISAFNVVVEALCGRGELDKALDLYRQVRHICRTGPNLRTFRPLWETCENAGVASFLASEMSALSIAADAPVYNRLVHIHATAGDLDVAFRYLMEMGSAARRAGRPKSAAPWATEPTLLALIRRCLRERDERAWDLVDEAKHRGMNVELELQEALVEAGGGKELAGSGPHASRVGASAPLSQTLSF